MGDNGLLVMSQSQTQLLNINKIQLKGRSL